MRIHSIFRLFKKLLFLFIVVAVLYALNKGLSDYVFEDDLLKEKLQAVKQGSVDKLPVPPSQNGDESRVFQEPKDPDSNNAPEEKEVKGEEKAPKEEAINREDRKKEVPKKGRIKGWDTKKEALIKEEMEKEDENEDDNEEEDKNEEDVNDEDKNEDDVFQGLEPFPEDDAFPQQLDKLEELGGFIAKKLPLEKYVDVEFPIFEDDVDPDGPGEGGAGAKMEKSRSMDAEQREKFDRGWQANSFNELNSERISVHRSLPDCKSRECKQVEEDFPEDFPSVSVIIIFHDEAWSVLLRSVHSILSRTPEHLLREIILVDDFSRNNLKMTFPEKVSLHKTFASQGKIYFGS
ncbi:N-acetylgalactosaminyltransferase 6-like [Aplysia californica]|uniref:N-acetylgalactosaminyltransferase 6-like n=1 Tax=Aplysia californica TaxID=6500 RepID=A0ABM1VSS3_APLCA|nr:N-acetylgalactosaminyltransferase 6-like [Aplysia californica]